MAGKHRFDPFRIRSTGFGEDFVEKDRRYPTMEEAQSEVEWRKNMMLPYEYKVVRRDRTKSPRNNRRTAEEIAQAREQAEQPEDGGLNW